MINSYFTHILAIIVNEILSQVAPFLRAGTYDIEYNLLLQYVHCIHPQPCSLEPRTLLFLQRWMHQPAHGRNISSTVEIGGIWVQDYHSRDGCSTCI